MIVAVAVEFLLGLGIALFLNRDAPGVGIMVIVLSLPVLLTPALSSAMFKYMFSSLGGVMYYYLTQLGLSADSAALLSYPQGAFAMLLINDIWEWTPFVALAFLYGLTTLPVEPIEAARVDGASSLETLRYLTLPMMRTFLLVIVILRMIDAFKIFDIVYPLTFGGPGIATRTFSFSIYLQAFTYLDLGTSAAMSVIMLLIVSALAQVYVRAVYRGEEI